MVPSPYASALAPDPAVADDVLGVGTGGGHCLDPHASPLVCDLVPQWLCAPSLHTRGASSPPAPPHMLVQHALEPTRGWRYSMGSAWPARTRVARCRGGRGPWQAYLVLRDAISAWRGLTTNTAAATRMKSLKVR